jgi:hypothetical protein
VLSNGSGELSALYSILARYLRGPYSCLGSAHPAQDAFRSLLSAPRPAAGGAGASGQGQSSRSGNALAKGPKRGWGLKAKDS